MICERLKKNALLHAGERTISDIRIGLRYTAVLLDDGSCGVAYTYQSGPACGCHVLRDAGYMIGEPVSEMISFLLEPNTLRVSVALAAVNAVINTVNPAYSGGNVVEALKITPDDTFGMVGEFKPIRAAVSKMTDRMYIFELNIEKGPGLYPEEAIPDYLPKCDVVVVTATSIINHTIDGVLEHCKNARQVCIVGPSTPLDPAAFAGTPVTLLAGSVVRDVPQLLQIVSQAGGTMHMKPAIDQVMLRV